MVGDPRSPPNDPLEDALYQWLDPERFGSSPETEKNAPIHGRDRARLLDIVSESSSDLRRVVDQDALLRRARARSRSRSGKNLEPKRRSRRVTFAIVFLVLGAIGACVGRGF